MTFSMTDFDVWQSIGSTQSGNKRAMLIIRSERTERGVGLMLGFDVACQLFSNL
jgi:hypothetical protein